MTPEREAEIRAHEDAGSSPIVRKLDIFELYAQAARDRTDLLAALDEARAERDAASTRASSEYERGVREAAGILAHPNAGLEPPDGGSPTPREMLDNCRAAILALLPPEQGGAT